MSNRVKGKVGRNRGNWNEFIRGLEIRLSFHEEKANELRPLIAGLKADRDRGVPFPAKKRATQI